MKITTIMMMAMLNKVMIMMMILMIPLQMPLWIIEIMMLSITWL